MLNGRPVVITYWHHLRVTYWRYIWPVSWKLYRKIQHHPRHLWWEEVDQLLEQYHKERETYPGEWPGVDRVRSHWDHHFATLDGRVRRRSEADTVVDGDYEGAARLEENEIRWITSRRTWISRQANPEAYYNRLSNYPLGLPTEQTQEVPRRRNNRRRNNRRTAPSEGTPEIE